MEDPCVIPVLPLFGVNLAKSFQSLVSKSTTVESKSENKLSLGSFEDPWFSDIACFISRALLGKSYQPFRSAQVICTETEDRLQNKQQTSQTRSLNMWIRSIVGSYRKHTSGLSC